MTDIQIRGYQWLDTGHYRKNIPNHVGPDQVYDFVPLISIEDHIDCLDEKEGEIWALLSETVEVKTLCNKLFWALAYANNSLEYLKDSYREIYKETGDSVNIKERADLLKEEPFSDFR
jgi:hypothetical protein